MPFLTSPVLPAGTFARAGQPTLPTGDGLLLRPWTPEDAPVVHDVFQDPVMHQWHARAAESESEAAGWIEEWRAAWAADREAQWAVADADTGRPVGRVALREVRFEDGAAEVAYWTAPAARGRGVASRATAALVHWAFEDTGFHRLELLHSVHNGASCRVATRTGFALEGTKRSSGLHADGWHDMHLHARVRGD
ncbi:GNAT family N-acetyltransferase [Streptomyces sp. 6-11-2]|uniref:GNAT family N-acetyltransferase n=1 Tax=Streptomyces sp. 6-11-2 TaxID=2585753 RepID=UPI0011419334|nr:GNAT family N-acetyltransferase [Streptomyces sp. 6-11-2]GED87994.1 acetyltransferase [Streptomyces sp. 6-11-2]